MEFSTNRFKKLSGLLKEDYGTEEGPFMPQQKSKRLLSIAYATALCKKHGHVSLGQIKYLLKKKENLDVKEEHIFDYLMVSGKFNRLQSASDKHMGMPVFGMKESNLQEIDSNGPTMDIKQIAFSELSDAYKEANGFRPRGVFDYEKMSLEDIEKAIEHYSSLPGAYDDFDFAAEDEHVDHMNMLRNFEDSDEQAIKDLGFDDEHDLLPKQSGMKMKHESAIMNEDWDNYTSVEEIEAKYLQKLMLAMGLSTSDARLPQVQEIFKTALKDAETLGQTKSGSAEPPTGV